MAPKPMKKVTRAARPATRGNTRSKPVASEAKNKTAKKTVRSSAKTTRKAPAKARVTVRPKPKAAPKKAANRSTSAPTTATTVKHVTPSVPHSHAAPLVTADANTQDVETVPLTVPLPPASPPPPLEAVASAASQPLLLAFIRGRGRAGDALLTLARRACPEESAPAANKAKSNSKKNKKPATTTTTTTTSASSSSAHLASSPTDVQDAAVTVLAMATHLVLLLCCRLTQHLTMRTNRAFLEVTARGRTPSNSDNDELADGDDDTNGADSSLRPRPDRHAEAAQESVFRSVRSTIAASCALGHRSCQAIWGPRGCGKHRVLRLVASDCARQNGTFVLQLHGDLLRSDVAALRVVASQMFSFLRSPQSASLRAADTAIAQGSFDFGALFQFPRRLAALAAVEAADGQPRAAPVSRDAPRRGPHTKRKHDDHTSWAHNDDNDEGDDRNDEQDDVVHEEEEDEEEEDDGGVAEAEEAAMLITSTTAYLSGGAASALSALQRALLLFKSYGVNIVVCIRHADQFGVWCDQLFYVLSGLMHEGDENGGGLSLVLSSSAPDIRQLEKRLSSRLTCETQYIPLLPWTARRLVRADVALLYDHVRCQVAQLMLTDQRLALEHEEDEATAAAARRGKGTQKKATRHDKSDSLFHHVDADKVTAMEKSTEALTRLAESLAGLLPDSFQSLTWLQWLGNTHKPLLEVADGWVRRQRVLATRSSSSSLELTPPQCASLPGDVFCEGALASLGTRWRPPLKRARDVRDDEEVSGQQQQQQQHEAAVTTTALLTSPSERAQHVSPSGSSKLTRVEADNADDDAASVEEDLTASETGSDRGDGADEDENDDDDDQTAPQVPSTADVGHITFNSVESLVEHPTLTLELLVVLCEKLLDELAPGPDDTDADQPTTTTTTTFAKRVHQLTAEQLATGATAPEALSAATSCLTSATSGALALLSATNAKAVVDWLSTRIDLAERGQRQAKASVVLQTLTADVIGPGKRIGDVLRERTSYAARHGTAWQKLSGRALTGLRLLVSPLGAFRSAPPASLRAFWQRAVQTSSQAASTTPVSSAHTVALLPPDMYDLLDDGSIVTLDYISREAFVLLFYVYQQQTYAAGSTGARSVGDLLEDVASSLGTRAAAALDRDAFRAAVHQLARWQLVQISASASRASDAHASAATRRSGAGHRDAELITLCGSKGRLQEFLRLVLDKHVDWCEDLLGLSSKDHMHMRSLV